MGKRIVVDPVTRIEGHLRVEVEINNGAVVDAWATGTMFRGLEQIIQGRDPRDAVYIAERICGVCMASHGWTASLAVEKAHGAELPPVARLIRNLLVGALWLHDHPLHFYHLSALDYLDVFALQDYQGNDRDLLDVKNKVLRLVAAGDAAHFTPRYQPDDYAVKDPEVVAAAIHHYLQALRIQAKAKKMSAFLGGKQPHQSSIIVGGVTGYPDDDQLRQFRGLLAEVADFIRKVYVPDVVYFATGPLLPLARAGLGTGPENYLAYGAFPMNDSGRELLFTGGFLSKGGRAAEVDLSKITEDVTSSWYRSAAPAVPWDGATEVALDKKGAYTFVKAPRYNGYPAEVGPLARMLIAGHKPLVDIMTEYGIRAGAVARHLARAQETLVITAAMFAWLNELEDLLGQRRYLTNGKVYIHDSLHWDPPLTGKGTGLNEAPRGALGHWVEIENQKVKNYQIVVPTTWNISPRDEKGIAGPIEQALIGIPVDPDNPVNLVRVIRSFDPCLACAVHVISSAGDRVLQIR
ncbi:MAG: nickel-dependent hydrogenase large subunit [Peptococcaceae bacterium]